MLMSRVEIIEEIQGRIRGGRQAQCLVCWRY